MIFMDTSRRSFLRMLAGAAAVAMTPAVKIIPALASTQESLRVYSFGDIVTATLRAYPREIAANVSAGNALLARLREPSENS
jgi:hypothetical protein